MPNKEIPKESPEKRYARKKKNSGYKQMHIQRWVPVSLYDELNTAVGNTIDEFMVKNNMPISCRSNKQPLTRYDNDDLMKAITNAIKALKDDGKPITMPNLMGFHQIKSWPGTVKKSLLFMDYKPVKIKGKHIFYTRKKDKENEQN